MSPRDDPQHDEPATLNGDQLLVIRERLRVEHASTERRLDALERTLDELLAAADGEPPDDEHDPDGTTAFERAQVASLAGEARATLVQLDRAIAAADRDDFGRCRTCGRPIGLARLDSLPAADECVGCASRRNMWP